MKAVWNKRKSMQAPNLQHVFVSSTPYQENGYDCAVFTCKFGEHVIRNHRNPKKLNNGDGASHESSQMLGYCGCGYGRSVGDAGWDFNQSDLPRIRQEIFEKIANYPNEN